MNTLNKVILAIALSWVPLIDAADMDKTLHIDFPAAATGFDPAKVYDLYSGTVNGEIYDTLYQYDYLARPVKIIPNTAADLPVISNNGKRFTIKIKPHIYFSPDPVFGSKKRELTAADYVYSIKRLLDPKVRSPWSHLVKGRLVGTDQLNSPSNAGKEFDYDAEIEGVKALDKYTLEINLTETFYDFVYILSYSPFAAVAQEVIETYADNTNTHPVGTGPYLLKSWQPGNKITLAVNPNYKAKPFNFIPNPNDAVAVRAANQMQGKMYPAIGNIEISIIEEEQPKWLSYLNKQLDMIAVPQAALQEALVINPNNPKEVRLADKYAVQNMDLQRLQAQELTFTYFNMEDPVIGGYEKEKIALRRAIALAFPRNESIARIRRGQAIPAQSLIGEGLQGHNPAIKAQTGYDPAKANALLDAVGYKIGEDGFRTQPDGAPLEITFASGPSAIDKQWNEYWQQAFDSIHIKLKISTAKWSEHLKAARQNQLQMWALAWMAGYPSGDEYTQLLYSKNPDGNLSNFKNEEYDKLYEQSLTLPFGPEKQKIYDRMNRIVIAYQPWVFGDIRIRSTIAHDHVKGLKVHPFLSVLRYLDIEK